MEKNTTSPSSQNLTSSQTLDQTDSNYSIFLTLKRLLKNIKNQNKKIFFYFFIYTLAAAIYPIFAVLLPKFMINEISNLSNAQVSHVILIAVIYFILAGGVGFIKTYFHDVTYPKLSRLRIDYVRDTCVKLMQTAYCNIEDAQFYNENEKAIKANQSNDNGVEGIYHKMFTIPAILVTILILIFFIGRLSVFVLIGLILHVAAITWVNLKTHQYRYGLKKEEAKWSRKVGYYSRTTSDFAYGKDIRLYNLKNRIYDNYSKEIKGYQAVITLMSTREYQLGFLSLAALLLSDCLTYFVLIKETVSRMSIADFSMYLTAIITVSLLLKQAAQDIAFIINEGQYVHEFYQFIDKDSGKKEGNHPAILDDTLEIELKNVSFRYPNTENYIFKNLNLTIQKGERLAIVGINGAGKSTLVKLITGLFDVTEGEIRINGINSKDYDKKALYSMFSVVFQEVNLLAFTVKENIACSSTQIDETKVATVLEKVGLTSKIEKLPKKLNQMVLKTIDENGALFSGGESQKLSIARALYKDANMIIMDEPTAALDALAEAEIYEDFSSLVKGKTAIYISHRLASTKFCDKIALFDNNGLKEYGTHEQLMNQHGSYYEMFMVQGKYYKEKDTDSQLSVTKMQ